MPLTTVPSDKATKDAINQFNLEMRGQQWYQDYFTQRGLDANKVKLSKQQREELEALAIANGAPKDAFDDMMIDPAGNLNTEHGFASLPTWAKIAIGAGAAAGAYFAAPVVGSSLGIGGSSTAPTGLAAIPASGQLGLGIAPSLAGSTAAGAGSAAAGLSGLGTAAQIAGVAGTGLSTMDKIGGMIGAASNAVGSATKTAGQENLLQTNLGMQANRDNIAGENAFQGQQAEMARLEAAQQEAARKNLYRSSVMKNPTVSIENRQGAPTFSSEMIEGLTNLEKAALDRTRTTQYSTAQMRAPRDYQPIDPKAIAPPSTMQTVGNWLAPTLSTIDMISDVHRRR